MFSQFPKKTLFSKLISGIVAVSFILTSVSVRGYADWSNADKLRRPAGNNQKTLEKFIKDVGDVSGGSPEAYGVAPVIMPINKPEIFVLNNNTSLPKGARTGRFPLGKAIEQGTNGVLLNHSETRKELEDNMGNMLGSIVKLAAEKYIRLEKKTKTRAFPPAVAELKDEVNYAEEIDRQIKEKWDQALQKEGLSKEEIKSTLSWQDEFLKDIHAYIVSRSIQASEEIKKGDLRIEGSARMLVNRVINIQLKEVIAKSKEYTFSQTVLCVGETREQYLLGRTFKELKGEQVFDKYLSENTKKIIGEDLTQILNGINKEGAQRIGLRVAYEPRWAINTGLTPSSKEIQDAHRFIKDTSAKVLTIELDVDYGLNDGNAEEIAALKDVDGGLIGGASKSSQKLGKIIDIFNRIGKQKGKVLNLGKNDKAETSETSLEPIENFVEDFKTKDLTWVRIAISTPDVREVKAKMAEFQQYYTKTHPKAEDLISRLQKSLKSNDLNVRKQVIDEIRAISPAVKNFLDLFLIAESGKIDDYLLSTLKARLLKEFASEKAPRRVAIIGTDPISLLSVRAALSTHFINDIDLVALIIGNKDSTEKVLPGILENSIHDTFKGRAKESGNGALINFDAAKQKKAVRVFKESAMSGNLSDSSNWKDLGIDTIIVDRDKFDNEIKKEGLEKLNAQGIQVVINAGAGADGAVTYIPGLPDEKEAQKGMAIGMASAEETAAVLGVKAVEALGKRVQVVSCRVARKQGTQKQPTYSIAGADQISHQKTEELRGIIASSLGLDLKQVAMTDEMKVPVSHGVRLELSVGVDSKVSAEHVIAHFKKLAEELDILSVPEDGVIITSNLAWKKRSIQFDNDKLTLSTQDYPGGTLVNIAFLIDEESMPVDFIMRAIAKRSSFKEKKEAAQAVKESYASSTIEADNERKARELKEKAAEEKADKLARKINEIREARKRIIEGAAVVGTSALLTEKKALLGPDLDVRVPARVLTDIKGNLVALISIDFDKNIIKANSLLSPVSLEKTQEALAAYYATLRDFALKLSVEKEGSSIEVIDNYKPEEKLRVKFSVSSNELQKTTFKSVEQFKDNKWVALCEPNMAMDYSQLKDKYNIILIGPGGRIGSLTFKLASEFANLNIVAVSGPPLEALAEFLESKDYIQGAFKGKIERGEDSITLIPDDAGGGKTSIVFSNRVSNTFRDTTNLPVGAFMFAGVNIHLVEDATGRDYSTAALDEYRRIGSLRVAATAPGEGDGWSNNTFVLGVNDYKYDPVAHFLNSFASCTTGTATTSDLGIEIAILIKKGLISKEEISQLSIEELKKKIYALVEELNIYEYAETFHAFTGEELTSDKIADAKKRTRNISGHDNILQTSSGMSKAVVPVDGAQVSIGGMAVRVPADTGSLLLQYFVLPGEFSKDDILAGYETLKLISNYVALEDIDDSGVIKNVDRLRRMMATISPSKIEVVNFKNDKGEDMSFISVAPWYENEKYYGFEVVNLIEKMRLREPKENFLVMGEDGRLKPLKLAEKKVTAQPKKQVFPEKIDLSAFRTLEDLRKVIKAKNIDTAIVDVDYNLSRKLVQTVAGDIIDIIEDDEPISASLNTVDKTLEDVDFVFIPTSSGRPKGQYKRDSEMQPIVERFKELKSDKRFKFLPGAVVVLLPVDLKEAEKTVDEAKKKFSGKKIIFFYENLRFYSAEESTSPEVRRKFQERLIKVTGRTLDKLVIINEAFEKNHRGEENASIEMLTLFPEENRAAGLSLLESVSKVLQFVNSVIGSWSVVPGGAKFDKWENIGELSNKVAKTGGTLLVVGALADPYLDSLGINVGRSLMPTDEKELKKVKSGIKKLKESGVKVIAPVDFIVKGMDEPRKALTGGLVQIDIGPESAKIIEDYIDSLKAGDGLVLNGGAGIFDNDELNAKEGTRRIVLAAKKAALRGVIVAVIGKDMKVAKEKILATTKDDGEKRELQEVINTKFINIDGGGVVWTALAKGIQNLSAIAAVMKTNAEEVKVAEGKPVIPAEAKEKTVEVDADSIAIAEKLNALNKKVTPQQVQRYNAAEETIFEATGGEALNDYTQNIEAKLKTMGHPLEYRNLQGVIITPDSFKIAGAKNMLSALINSFPDVKVGIGGKDAEAFKILLGREDAITGKTVEEVWGKMAEDMGIMAEHIIILRHPDDIIDKIIPIRQIVVPENIPATLAGVKIVTELYRDTTGDYAKGDFMKPLLQEFLNTVTGAGIIEVTPETKEKLLAELEQEVKEGIPFEFSKTFALTKEKAQKIEQELTIIKDFLGV